METPDPATIVFDLGQPQPLFLSALAATYGPQIVNVAAVMANEEEGDFGNTWLQLNAKGPAAEPGGWSRSNRARRSSWSATMTTGAAGKAPTSSGSSSASSRKR